MMMIRLSINQRKIKRTPLTPEMEKFITWGLQALLVGSAGFICRQLQKFSDKLSEFQGVIQGIVKDFNWHSSIHNSHTVRFDKVEDKIHSHETRLSVLERSHQCIEP